ncbi:hypothetical protein H1C71_023032, partial [Ictidomys tridecemlineatus]
QCSQVQWISKKQLYLTLKVEESNASFLLFFFRAATVRHLQSSDVKTCSFLIMHQRCQSGRGLKPSSSWGTSYCYEEKSDDCTCCFELRGVDVQWGQQFGAPFSRGPW